METLITTDGLIRGIIGQTLTPLVVTRLASAFAAALPGLAPPSNGKHYRIVVARDARPSGTFVRDCAVAALSASGIEVIDLDIVTAPGAAMMLRHLGADGAVIITAGHDPIQWNGLKFLNSQGIPFSSSDGGRIHQFYLDGQSAYVGAEKLIPLIRNSQTHALHVKRLLDYVDVLGISTRRFKVVLDSVNGAGCVASATLLSKLGCILVHLNATPDGQFPHEPEPVAANLASLAAEVRRQRAAIGFAQDPDGSCLAIVDENGKCIDREKSLALAACKILAKRPGVVVTDLSAAGVIENLAHQHGGSVARVAAGEAKIAQAMLAQNAVIGGSANGGVIDARIVPAYDSLVAMAYVLQLMADSGKSISRLVGEMPHADADSTAGPP